MQQDLAYHPGFRDIGYPTQSAAAFGAGGDVDAEDTAQTLGPCHGRHGQSVVVERGRARVRVVLRALAALSLPGGAVSCQLGYPSTAPQSSSRHAYQPDAHGRHEMLRAPGLRPILEASSSKATVLGQGLCLALRRRIEDPSEANCDWRRYEQEAKGLTLAP